MTIRLWDVDRDAPGALAELWNDCYGTTLFGVTNFDRLYPENTIVAYDDGLGRLVASTFLMDGGPHAFLDEIVVLPGKWRHTVMRDILRFAETLCRARGIPWFNGVLGMSGGDAEKFLSFLKRRDALPMQYLGERPMYCRRLT